MVIVFKNNRGVMSAGGWARVANGLRLVASDGAARIASAAATSSVATRHVPELAEKIVRAGSDRYAEALRSSLARQSTAAARAAAAGASSERGTRGEGGAPSDGRDGLSSRMAPLGSVETARQATLPEIDGAQVGTQGDIDVSRSTLDEASSSIIDPSNQQAELHTDAAESYDDDHQARHLPEGSAVPSTRLSRAFGFASLGAGLAVGTVSEIARRALGSSERGGPLVLSNDANAQRLSASLRRMRGAAMKLGQMLSIQDESIAPPALTNALAQVRKGAEAMPQHQLLQQLDDQWGDDWRARIELEDRPFAAASIGQVHRGTLFASSDPSVGKVAVKVQYPGVADSIESDLSNLSMLVKATGLAPPGLFLDNVIRVGRDELKVECDYRREASNQERFRDLVSSDPNLASNRFVVPRVVDELSTDRILVTELVRGGTIDKVVDLDQTERNRIGRAIMRLTMLELFVWRFMQTDPNWGNFLYDVRTGTTYLIDFGAAREYDEDFVKGYLNIVVANANLDERALMDESVRMGFLTGEENDAMMEAHKLSGFCLGEPFQSYEPYDFKSSRITSRISEHGSVFLRHRLTPPPEEVYTLHRKLAGAYNLCIKLGAKISCRDLLDEVIEHYA